MKRKSIGLLVLLWMASTLSATTFEPPGIRLLARGLGIGYGPGYHAKPAPPNLRPHYQRVTTSQPWRVIPRPAYPASPFAPTASLYDSNMLHAQGHMDLPQVEYDSPAPHPGRDTGDREPTAIPDEVHWQPKPRNSGMAQRPTPSPEEISKKYFDKDYRWEPAPTHPMEDDSVYPEPARRFNETDRIASKPEESDVESLEDLEPSYQDTPLDLDELLPKLTETEPAEMAPEIAGDDEASDWSSDFSAPEDTDIDPPATVESVTPESSARQPEDLESFSGNPGDNNPNHRPGTQMAPQGVAAPPSGPVQPLAPEILPNAAPNAISPNYPGYRSLESGSRGATNRPPRRRAYGNPQAWW